MSVEEAYPNCSVCWRSGDVESLHPRCVRGQCDETERCTTIGRLYSDVQMLRAAIQPARRGCPACRKLRLPCAEHRSVDSALKVVMEKTQNEFSLGDLAHYEDEHYQLGDVVAQHVADTIVVSVPWHRLDNY